MARRPTRRDLYTGVDGYKAHGKTEASEPGACRLRVAMRQQEDLSALWSTPKTLSKDIASDREGWPSRQGCDFGTARRSWSNDELYA